MGTRYRLYAVYIMLLRYAPGVMVGIVVRPTMVQMGAKYLPAAAHDSILEEKYAGEKV